MHQPSSNVVLKRLHLNGLYSFLLQRIEEKNPHGKTDLGAKILRWRTSFWKHWVGQKSAAPHLDHSWGMPYPCALNFMLPRRGEILKINLSNWESPPSQHRDLHMNTLPGQATVYSLSSISLWFFIWTMLCLLCSTTITTRLLLCRTPFLLLKGFSSNIPNNRNPPIHRPWFLSRKSFTNKQMYQILYLKSSCVGFFTSMSSPGRNLPLPAFRDSKTSLNRFPKVGSFQVVHGLSKAEPMQLETWWESFSAAFFEAVASTDAATELLWTAPGAMEEMGAIRLLPHKNMNYEEWIQLQPPIHLSVARCPIHTHPSTHPIDTHEQSSWPLQTPQNKQYIIRIPCVHKEAYLGWVGLGWWRLWCLFPPEDLMASAPVGYIDMNIHVCFPHSLCNKNPSLIWIIVWYQYLLCSSTPSRKYLALMRLPILKVLVRLGILGNGWLGDLLGLLRWSLAWVWGVGDACK